MGEAEQRRLAAIVAADVVGPGRPLRPARHHVLQRPCQSLAVRPGRLGGGLAEELRRNRQGVVDVSLGTLRITLITRGSPAQSASEAATLHPS